MPVNATLGNQRTDTTTLGGNVAYRGVEWQPKYVPDYHIYLFNVSARLFEKVGPYQKVTIPGLKDDDPWLPEMKENEKYHFVTSFPQPMMIFNPNDQTGEIGVLKTDARRYVMDIINPDNMTFSLDTMIPQEHVFSVGNDLSRSGVFFSLSNPPAAADVKAAYARMEKHYNHLLQRAEVLEMTDKPKLSEELGSNPDYAFAAEYFNKDYKWRKKNIRPEQCRNCGETKPFGTKYHMSSAGYLCIDPTQDGWKAAVLAGAKRKEDVPEGLGLRWWVPIEEDNQDLPKAHKKSQ